MGVPEATRDNDAAHFAALTTTRGVIPDDSKQGLTDAERWGVKYLYDRLNILDSKTSSLLRFNGWQ